MSRHPANTNRQGIVTLNAHESATRLQALRTAVLEAYVDEDLHQLRITLRRLRSNLRDARGKNARRLRRQLGALARATNSARDWDTLVTSAQTQLRPEQFRALQPALQASREKAHVAVYRMFHSRDWLAAIAELSSHSEQSGSATGLKAITPGELKKRLKRARESSQKAITHDKDKHWHRLRIAIKELRYALDTRANLSQNAAMAELVEHCKSLQGLLGDWHDTVVHRHLLTQLCEGVPLDPEKPAGKAANALRQVLALRGRECLSQVRRTLLRQKFRGKAVKTIFATR